MKYRVIIEVRCKIPQGVGLWPALWLYGNGNGVKIAIPRPGIYVARVMANNGEYVKQIVVK